MLSFHVDVFSVLLRLWSLYFLTGADRVSKRVRHEGRHRQRIIQCGCEEGSSTLSSFNLYSSYSIIRNINTYNIWFMIINCYTVTVVWNDVDVDVLCVKYYFMLSFMFTLSNKHICHFYRREEMESVSLAEPRRRQKWTLNPRGDPIYTWHFAT